MKLLRTSIVAIVYVLAMVCAEEVGDGGVAPKRKEIFTAPPVIDIAPLIQPDRYTEADRQNVQEAILRASSTWGFFQILNHGISQELQQQLMDQMQLFFHSPKEVKYTIRRTENNSRGFADDELTKRLKDVKEIVDIGQVPHTDITPQALANQALDGVNQWPSAEYTHLQDFKPTADAYYDACLQLSRTLTAALAASIPCGNASYFASSFDHHSSFLRLNYYPVLTDGIDAGATPEKAEGVQDATVSDNGADAAEQTLPRRLGVSRHTDAGALTVLLQDWNPAVTSGLEVYSGSKEDAGDGEWVPVRPVPGSLTINTGDMMQVWSNGLLKAPEHRVRPTMDAERVRYSAPFFYNPNYDAIVTPLPAGCTEAERTSAAPPSLALSGAAVSADGAVQTAAEDSSDATRHTDALPRVSRTALYGAIRWGDYRNMRFQGDFKDVGEEVQIEHFQAQPAAAEDSKF